MSKVIFIHDKYELDNQLQDAGDKLIVLEFCANWCGLCKVTATQLEELAATNSDIIVLHVDIEETGELAEEYNISVLPTIKFVRNQTVIDSFCGTNIAGVLNAIEEINKKQP